MNEKGKFTEKLKTEPFQSYDEYMDYIFACCNAALAGHIRELKRKYVAGQGGYKNVMYPDIEIASNLCEDKIQEFEFAEYDGKQEAVTEGTAEELPIEIDAELEAMLKGFSQSLGGTSDDEDPAEDMSVDEMLSFIDARVAVTNTGGELKLPFYELCRKLSLEHFSIFALACALLASTQTSYAAVFQIANENGGQTTPTVESAARLFFGRNYSATTAYSEMSVCLDQLLPVLDLRVNSQMPFSTLLTPDKRMLDYLFGRNPFRLDENYSRFIKMLTDDRELDPIMANGSILDAMKIAYGQGIRIVAYSGDEGSGRKFFVKHFCKERNMKAVTINCKKLFTYDFGYVEKALWAAVRECIFMNACCVLDELTYREEEKEKFLGYMDLAFGKLVERDIPVFTISREKLNLKEVTMEEYVDFDLPAPSNEERQKCWEYYAKDYELAEDCDLLEMTIKFIFTPGKVADALKHARTLATMEKLDKIPRALLFKGCNAQMSSELSQKATRVEAKFGFDDIVMNADQRETITHVIEQMNFKKQVYEKWNYVKKYPYGRGLTVLLFGAPGTGKSMMAQVLAHELNLELYRVDISKVVDKYVGETEKSLSMIFREAKKCNVVLFFDECDTIFAKRSDDGGSNQASANNKTALLLQEMEAYDGVCVLATNYKHNIDPAFFRRMKYIVEFQFPDPDTREMLWRTTIPKTTPLNEDVDIRFLAERFEFAGGNIKNCILNAAFLAAADGDGEEVCMRHYLQAIRYEFVKTGKVFTKADFEPYAYMVGLGENPDEMDVDF